MKQKCGELVTDEEFAQSCLGSVDEEIRLLEALVRRMKAGEDVSALLETVLPIIEDIERLELQRLALLASRDRSVH
jgi:hypothetical protein